MKQISSEQIKYVLAVFYDCNVPVKAYEGLAKLFNDLPLVEPVEITTKGTTETPKLEE
jgi:hypothetical protein